MQKRTLSRPIMVIGHNLWGRHASVTIRPRSEPGIIWITPMGKEVPIGEATLGYSSLLHCLALTHGSETLRVVEHLLGCCYALGLGSASIVTDPRGLPHAGTAARLWHELWPALLEDGELNRYTPNKIIEIRRGKRLLLFHPDSQTESLRYEIYVDYGTFGSARVAGALHQTDLDALFQARPYWRPLHRVISRVATQGGWPHQLEHLAVSLEASAKGERGVVLREIARHRLLDFLGMLATATPPGGTIVGHVHMRLAGHKDDLEVRRQLNTVGLYKL